MPSTNLLPDGNGHALQWTVGAGTRPTCVQTHDSDTSYVWINRTQAGTDAYTVDNMPANAGPITLVQSCFAYRRSGTGTNSEVKSGAYYSGAHAWGALHSIGDSYVQSSDTLAQAPGGGSWTKAILDSSQVEFYNDGTGDANSVRVTMARLYVEYELAGGFSFIIVGSLAAGLLVFPFLEDFCRHVESGRPRVADAAALRTPRLRPDELSRTWREYREHPFPRYFDLGATRKT